MNNKRNISFTTKATVLILAILVIVSCSGLIVVGNELNFSDDSVAIEMMTSSTIPNLDFNNSLLLDSSIQEDIKGVVNNHASQKPVNSKTTITSHSTAISFDFICPERISKTVLVPELTIFPMPILKLIPNFGTDFHEIEFSLHSTFNKLNEQYCGGLEFDFYGFLNTDRYTINLVIV